MSQVMRTVECKEEKADLGRTPIAPSITLHLRVSTYCQGNRGGGGFTLYGPNLCFLHGSADFYDKIDQRRN